MGIIGVVSNILKGSRVSKLQT